MGSFIIHLTTDDFEGDASKEILMEVLNAPNDPDPLLVYASSSEKNGFYDRSSSPGDADGDGDVEGDIDDKILFLNLANAFAAMKGYTAKRRKK